jgi:hypothetical protein
MTNTTTNSGLARRVTHVMDALTGYDHLPLLGHISVYRSGMSFLSSNRYGQDAVRDVCVWADAFDVPVVIDLSDTGRVVAVLELGGVEVSLRQYVSHREAYEYGAALGVPVTAGGQVQVAAAALLAALNQQNGVAA